MSTSLTTLAKFKAYAGITGSSQDTIISAMIPFVSGQIERYLRRTLTATTYKSWYDGLGAQVLRLNQYPITAVYQVCVGSNSVATVQNDSASVSQASVSFDGTNLVLIETSTAGVDTITEIPVATYKTLATLETAIESHSGWSLTLGSTEYSTMPTSILRPLYSQNAGNSSTASLVMPDKTVSTKIVHEDMIEIINSDIFPTWDIFPMDRQPNRMSAVQPGITPPTFSYGFPPGSKNIFVWFKAGYTLPTDSVTGDLPDGLSLIVHQCLSDAISSIKLNSNLQSESIGDYSYSLRSLQSGKASAAILSVIENHKRDLNAYRRVSI